MVLIGCACLTSYCSTLISSVTQGFAEDLSVAILESEDLEMVREGAPAYLILLDGLISNSPDDKFLLRQSAVLHSAYAGAFVDDPGRSKLLAGKAKNLAIRAICLSLEDGCGIDDMNYQELTDWLKEQPDSSIEFLYTLASTWIGWIQANSDDFENQLDFSPTSLSMSNSLTEALEIASDFVGESIPVVEEGSFIGAITEGDLFTEVLNIEESLREEEEVR